MGELMISGSRRTSSTIQISGAKNATLPLMAACLLTQEDVTLDNVPNITDVEYMKKQLQSYGVQVTDSRNGSRLKMNSSRANFAPANDAGTNTRGAFLVLGALVARFGQARVYTPGGCQIGKGGRPVNFHINALAEMGAQVTLDPQNQNIVKLRATNGLHGARIHFPKVSVGATENIMMAACRAEGETVITNAAVEPEITDLADMLMKMGANIEVIPQRKMITIRGRAFLSGTTHTVIPDRIEAGTYAIAAAITRGPLLLKMDPDKAETILIPVIEKLQAAGVTITKKRNGLEVQRTGEIYPVDITTGPYPEFPTDLLPQWVTFMTLARGDSHIKDTIYDNRFKHVPYLTKMGAKIAIKSDNYIIVHGNASLRGTHVIATDLRAGVALVLAALAAAGTTVVKEIHHVHRGYENLKDKLKQCGAILQELPPTRPGHYGYSQ